MKNLKLIIGVVLLMCALSSNILAQQGQVEVEFFSDKESIEVGEVFNLALKYTIQKGYHIYWKNSGDTGLPTSAAFDLPRGFQLLDVVWSIPERFTPGQGITAFGYSKEAYLLARVKAPQKLTMGEKVSFSVLTKWLSCGALCIPGKKMLTLQVGTNEAAELTRSQEFEKLTKLLPLDINDSRVPFKLLSSPALDKQCTEGSHEIVLEWERPFEKVEWFPEIYRDIELTELGLGHEGVITKISFKLMQKTKISSESNGCMTLVVFEDDNGDRIGVNVPVGM